MKKKDLVLLLLILILAAALVFTLLYIREVKQERISESYVELLRQIDGYLSEGYSRKAAENILRLAETDVSAATYLQLLKRAHALTEQGEGFETFVTVAELGREDFPARGDIAALLVYGYLRTDNAKKAEEVAQESKIRDPRWSPILAESAIVNGTFLSMEQVGEDVGESRDLYRRVMESEDPEIFEEAWRRTGASAFLLDAVLLELLRGGIYEASELLQGLPRDSHAKLRFFVAYDGERWRRAEALLGQIPTGNGPAEIPRREKLMLEADLALRRGDHSKAAGLYERFVSEYPGYTWSSYYNLAYIRYSDAQEGKAFGEEFMEGLVSSAAEGSGRILDLAELMLAFGDTQSAEYVLSRIPEEPESAPHLRLLREKTKRRVNPERYKSLLRVLVNRSGGERYAAHLAWFLIGVEDYDSLEELISYYAEEYGEPAWLRFYRGILHAERGDYEEALTSFSHSLDAREHWEAYYNMAIIAALQNDPTRGVALLEKAAHSAGNSPEARSEILAAMAEIKYRNGRREEARADAERALSYDPANSTAQLIVNTLETSKAE